MDNIAETTGSARTASKANIEETLGIALGAAQTVSTTNKALTLRASRVMHN